MLEWNQSHVCEVIKCEFVLLPVPASPPQWIMGYEVMPACCNSRLLVCSALFFFYTQTHTILSWLTNSYLDFEVHISPHYWRHQIVTVSQTQDGASVCRHGDREGTERGLSRHVCGKILRPGKKRRWKELSCIVSQFSLCDDEETEPSATVERNYNVTQH